MHFNKFPIILDYYKKTFQNKKKKIPQISEVPGSTQRTEIYHAQMETLITHMETQL